MWRKRVREKMSIATAVSSGQLLKCALRVETKPTAGFRVTLTTLGDIKRGGTNSIPSPDLRLTSGRSGTGATGVTTEIGNEK